MPRPEEEVDVIRTAEDVEKLGAITSEGEGVEDAEAEDVKANLASEESETSESESDSEANEDDDKIVLDGEELTREEVEKIFSLGKSITNYQKQHPGFDPLLIERDYRIKTAELARFKEAAEASAKPNVKTEEVDLSDIDPEDVKKFAKIAKSQGYVSQAELEAREQTRSKESYETTKNKVTSDFLALHPEYRPENDPGDAKWNTLLKEFNLYKLPSDPAKLSELLERAHSAVSPSEATRSRNIDVKQAAKILAQQRANKASTEKTAGAGASQKVEGKQTSSVTINNAKHYLKGYSDEEIKELFT